MKEIILKKEVVEYQDTEYREVKKCIVCKQITLYYKHVDINKIELLRFWNNFQDKNKLKL